MSLECAILTRFLSKALWYSAPGFELDIEPLTGAIVEPEVIVTPDVMFDYCKYNLEGEFSIHRLSSAK